MEITPTTVVAAARDQVSTELEGEVVILNFADQVYYGLDAVGAHVWALLAEPRAVAELVGAVTGAFDVDAATAERDLLDLLRDLAGRRLIEVRPG